jgi:putative transcriptional regulator
MTNKKKFKTDAFAAIHKSALALHGVGAIDKATMRKFDESCIAKTPTFEATQIKQIRERAKVSQPIFAMYLNTSESTIQKWESPASGKHPVGAAAKLLQIIEKKGIDALAC